MTADHYGLLFYYPQRNAAVGRIWSEPGNVSDLEELVKDSTAPAKVRFLAAEVLFARDVFFVDRAGEALVAQLYADALVNGYTGHANAWGCSGNTTRSAKWEAASSSSARRRSRR